MDSQSWLTKAISRGAGGCTTSPGSVESEINITQHLAKKGDIYYYDMDKLLFNLFKLGTCRASFVPKWYLTQETKEASCQYRPQPCKSASSLKPVQRKSCCPRARHIRDSI